VECLGHKHLLGSGDTRVEAVQGRGKFSFHWLAEYRLNTVEFAAEGGGCVFLVYEMERSESCAKRAR
jgi:hypothetical protein